MPPQLEDVLKKVSIAWTEVSARYASAMCAAQLLERELVTILGFLKQLLGQLTSDNNWAYAQIERMKAKELLKLIRGCGGNLSSEENKIIEEALNSRNFLAHGFFHKYNPVMTSTQCKRAIRRHRTIESELDAAYRLLQPLRQNLEKRLNLSAVPKELAANFKKLFVEAVGSFYDE
jgi:hypothetical protein